MSDQHNNKQKKEGDKPSEKHVSLEELWKGAKVDKNFAQMAENPPPPESERTPVKRSSDDKDRDR